MRILALLSSAVVVLAAVVPAWAQMNPALLRNQTRMIERAVSRNLDRVFKPKLVVSKGATGPVTALALSRDERHLVTAVGNNSVRVWDLWVGREVARLSGHSGRVTDVAVARDGRRAVTVAEDRSVRVWNLTALGEVAILGEHAAAVTGVALAGDSSRVFTAASDGRIRVTALATGAVEREFAAHGAGVVRLAATNDGSRLVSAGSDGRVRVWETATGRRIADLDAGDAALSVTLSANDTQVAVGTDGGRVRVWTLDGAEVASLRTGVDRVLSVAFAPNGSSLLMGGSDGSVMQAAPVPGSPVKVLGKHDGKTTYVTVSGDSGFALSGSEDGSSRLWSLATGAPLLTLISTESGWAVVDAKGRYDGSEQALSGIDWQASDASANIEDFAETHYQGALLPRTLQGDDIADAATIPDGVRYPPSVRFVSPSPAAGTGTRAVVVEVVAEDNGGGVAEVRLYRNGKLLPRGIGQVDRQEQNGAVRLTARYEVELAGGANVLSATAVNNERLESRPQVLKLGDGPAMTGKLHVLTVGINAYAQAKLNLEYAKPDATAIAGFVGSGGQTSVPVAEVVSLEDGKATKEAILAAIRRLRTVPSEDVVLVYMAGHGVSVGDDWYFISHEIAIPNRPDKLAGMALSSAELKAEVESMSADRTLLLLDTCHSGTAVSPLKDYRGMKALRLLARSVGTHVLAATDRNQYAVELEALGHGVFTYTVLAGLNGEADSGGDGTVSATELIRFVEEKVPALSQKFAEYAQYPTGYSRGSDFSVARK